MHKKVSLLSAYISVHKFDFICLSETYLPFKLIHFISLIHPFHETISFEIRIGEKNLANSFAFIDPQTNDEFESFLKNVELILDKIHEENPSMIFVLGDFNAKSNNWCKNHATSHEGSRIEAVTSNYGLHQLIQEPTHILNSSSSCIDLIFNLSTKFTHGIRRPFIFPSKLLSSSSLSKI